MRNKQLMEEVCAILKKFRKLPLEFQEKSLANFDSFIQKESDAEIKSFLVELRNIFTEAKNGK